MYQETVKAMQLARAEGRLGSAGRRPRAAMPPAEFEKLIHSEIAKWAKVVKDAGAKIDN